MPKITLFLVLLLTFAGCSTSRTGYFDSRRLGHNIFEITFTGTPLFSKDEALNLCLQRCAEVTVQRGYKYFTVADKDSGLYSYFHQNALGEYRLTSINTVAYNIISCTNQRPAGKEEYLFIDAEKLMSNQ